MKYIFTLSACCLAIASINATAKEASNDSSTISFLAFGDGGYSTDYPKQKHIDNPKNAKQFIESEKQDWLEDHRPIEEFAHAPIFVYPNTDIATEQSGAKAVGQAMATLCKTAPCDFAIQLGDNIYPDGADANDGKDDEKRMNDLILAPLKPLFDNNKSLVIYSALGNHDWKTSRKGVALQTAWMAKQPNFVMDKQGYYSFKQGLPGNDVEFFVIDTNMLLAGQHYYEVPLNADGSEQSLASALAKGQATVEEIEQHETPLNGEDHKQLAWLAKGLKNSTAKWKIVYGHHILWSIGGTKYDEGHVLRRLILPELCKYADAYIAGHEHDLELLTDDCTRVLPPNHSKPKLPLIISGAASKMRGTHTPFAQYQERQFPEYDLVWAKSFTWGFAHIELDNVRDKLSVNFYSTPQNGTGELIKERSFSFSHRSD
ncbi:metallophosphoesterase [Pseudoalteromonas sp. S16_S37]|uniref:metallophosphoesterase n=1 Tax=Pseudoalteromonas sp. S16_S37 TaxID=2720228 RepID=UPI0016805038|nr:metallophosphoesterase [Pseudoalteromonas sp. S16_S37]MBD1582133.1 serine/threonine protein phosphatase [Pseudoalteromonas sp. S16_S37]